MLLLSVGFHGLLLFTSMPTQRAEFTKKTPTQDQVKITQLPTSANSSRVIKKSSRLIVKSPPIRKSNRLIAREKFVAQPAIKTFPEVAVSSKTANPTSQVLAYTDITLPNPNIPNNPFVVTSQETSSPIMAKLLSKTQLLALSQFIFLVLTINVTQKR